MQGELSHWQGAVNLGNHCKRLWFPAKNGSVARQLLLRDSEMNHRRSFLRLRADVNEIIRSVHLLRDWTVTLICVNVSYFGRCESGDMHQYATGWNGRTPVNDQTHV